MMKTQRPQWFFALWLVLPCVLGVRLTADGAETTAKVDYKKAVPILQPMKEVAPTPEINLTTPDGKKISLRDFRGKVVMLNFWATWCTPCREEMPAMEKLYQEFKDRNFAILAVAVKDRKQDTIDFVKELKLTYPIALDPEAKDKCQRVEHDPPTDPRARLRAAHFVEGNAGNE